MRYFKSVYTGQIYCVSFVPKGFGWVEVSKERYEQWKAERGF